MDAAESPPEVAGLLGRLRERLAARADVIGVYVYGSLMTGDYSPAASDIDVVVLMHREPDQAVTRELTELQTAGEHRWPGQPTALPVRGGRHRVRSRAADAPR